MLGKVMLSLRRSLKASDEIGDVNDSEAAS